MNKCYLTIDPSGVEKMFDAEPEFELGRWVNPGFGNEIILPSGTCKALVGHELDENRLYEYVKPHIPKIKETTMATIKQDTSLLRSEKFTLYQEIVKEYVSCVGISDQEDLEAVTNEIMEVWESLLD